MIAYRTLPVVWTVIAVVCLGAVRVQAGAEGSDGFRVIRITNTPNDREQPPRINDRGEVVYSCRLNQLERREEIFYWFNGLSQRLTDDDARDIYPDINNNGTIIWAAAIGPDGRYGPTFEMVRIYNGTLEILTDNDTDDRDGVVSEADETLWLKETGRLECHDSPEFGIRALQLGDDQIQEIFDDEQSNQEVESSTSGTVVFTNFDFCPSPAWEARVLMYRDGDISVLSEGPTAHTPSIAPNGLVAWTNEDGVEVLANGVTTRITDNGELPFINSRGDVVFIRWNEFSRVWQTWLYIGGEFRTILGDGRWNVANDINEWGDIVLLRGYPGQDYDIHLYQRLPDGDMNCDGLVDFDDIDGFVTALFKRDIYEKAYPDCDWWLADMSGNRSVDFDDIDGFIDCLVDGGCERQ